MDAELERPRIVFSPLQNIAMPDCDCACAVEGASPPVPQDADLWIAEEPVYAADLISSEPWRLHYTPHGRAPIVLLNASADRLWRAFSTPARLADVAQSLQDQPIDAVQKAFSRLLEAGMLRPADRVGEGPSVASVHTFTAWLHLTDACNLACPYCYVPRRASGMDAETARRIVARLIRLTVEQGYRRLHLKYAGGEPTLNFKGLRAAHMYAGRLADEYDLELTGVVLTNGVAVTEEMLRFLGDAGLRVAVSLDGGLEAHDRLRAFPDGKSTYRRVTDFVDRALGLDIPVSISITLTALNLAGSEEAVRFALERALPFNLNFYRGWEGRAAAALAPKADALIATLRRCFAVMEDYFSSYPRPLTGILDRARFELYHRYPCSAGRHYVAVDAGGTVAPCQMLLGRPVASLSSPRLLASVREESPAVMGRPVESFVTCRACPWRYACGGGCPLLRGTALHARYCRVYRALYPELVLLEGRRLAARVKITCSEKGISQRKT